MVIGVAKREVPDGDERAELARSLIEHLDAGDDYKVNEVIDKLVNIRESELFIEVGKLTRQLHDSIGQCFKKQAVSSIASHDIPNARERLNYVIEKTEESANRTLAAVEVTAPISEELQTSARQMSEDWARFKRREMTADDFRELSKKITEFLNTVSSHSITIHDNITEILMAQEFQDLTGQTIKQVLELVEKVEDNLVDLIKCQGNVADNDQKLAGPDIVAEGPQIKSQTDKNVMSSQDDVDDLLSSLGF